MSRLKIWLISRREYLYNLRRKSFLFTAFIMPILIVGIIYLSVVLTQDSEGNLDDYAAVGVVDNSGLLARVADTEGEFARYQLIEDEDAARAAFNAGEIDAYFVVPTDYLGSGAVDFYDDEGLSNALRSDFADFIVAGISTLAPPDSNVERLRDPLDLEELRILGEDESLDENTLIARFVAPIIFVVLFSITVLVTSQFLMTGVVEEKENRVSEILLTSTRASELVIGKLLGLGALALTQIVYMVSLGLILGLATGRLDILNDVNLELVDFALLVTYFMLSFVLFASIMLGIGAAVSAEQESRQVAAIFSLMSIAPIYATPLFLTSPQSIIVTALSLFPFTAPVTVLLLLGFGALRVWQLALSLIFMVGAIVFVVWASSKVFRQGVLQYDQRLNLKQIGAILRRGEA